MAAPDAVRLFGVTRSAFVDCMVSSLKELSRNRISEAILSCKTVRQGSKLQTMRKLRLEVQLRLTSSSFPRQAQQKNNKQERITRLQQRRLKQSQTSTSNKKTKTVFPKWWVVQGRVHLKTIQSLRRQLKLRHQKEIKNITLAIPSSMILLRMRALHLASFQSSVKLEKKEVFTTS